MPERLTKPQRRIMVRAFSANMKRAAGLEALRGLPLSLGTSKALDQLTQMGLLERRESKLATGGGLPPMIFQGHELTSMGHYWAARCAAEEDDA